MALPNRVSNLTESEYLAIERAADFRSEFFEGEMFAMAGGTRRHSMIAVNLGRELSLALKGGPCVVLDSNMRVRVDETGLYTYPDLSVACDGGGRFADDKEDVLLNPTLLCEVLSDSTEAYDRGKKFEHYRQIPSLREYLLVSQAEPRIEQFLREQGGAWTWREAVGLGAVLELPSLGVSLALAEVFARAEFGPVPLRSRV